MLMGKYGIIEDSRKRCRCGRIKPAGRTVYYTCKPRYSRKEPPDSVNEPYTLPDWVAQVSSCGSWSWVRRSRRSGRWSAPREAYMWGSEK